MNLRYVVWYRGEALFSSVQGAFPTEHHVAAFLLRQSLPAERLVVVDTQTGRRVESLPALQGHRCGARPALHPGQAVPARAA